MRWLLAAARPPAEAMAADLGQTILVVDLDGGPGLVGTGRAEPGRRPAEHDIALGALLRRLGVAPE